MRRQIAVCGTDDRVHCHWNQLLDVCVLCLCVQALRSCWGGVQQLRGYYVDWRMLRDVKRRQMAFDFADERLRINALRKNNVLPKELQVRAKCSTP